MIQRVYPAEDEFARDLVTVLAHSKPGFYYNPQNDQKLRVKKSKTDFVNLDLTPFHAHPLKVTANPYFNNIRDIHDLISAYHAARDSMLFEDTLENLHVHTYADQYLARLFEQAQNNLSSKEAQLIGNWVKNFDIYVSVKCIESLLCNKADMTILEIAETLNWNIHFDHLAIRCGSAKQQHAEAVVELLTKQHGYIAPQIKDEVFYQFADGWNAYLLYKVLENGQILRLFIDQSDSDTPQQIIQHWNYVYGFTAHHIAIRATKLDNQQREAVSLHEMINTFRSKNIKLMTPTGNYTHGLLQQVFTRPEVDKNLPEELAKQLSNLADNLDETIKNAKLLELVSRTEMNIDFAKRFYELYDLEFDSSNPLHTAAIYNYFLPAQAAHVIKTSLNTFQ